MKYYLTIILASLFLSFHYHAGAQCLSDCGSCDETEQQAQASRDNAGSNEFQKIEASDEFQSFDESDEFQPVDNNDEFTEFNDEAEDDEEETFASISGKLKWPLLALGLTALAGFLVRYNSGRKFRYIFLLGSLVFFGFYLGGCPCPISSFQNLTLAGLGAVIDWTTLIWFLGLIPLTYFLGKTWCGWVCHLGALQEFLFRSNKLEFLKSPKSQKVMKYIRWGLVAALLIQLAITQTNLFCKVDPFKAAFNLASFYTAGWVLLGLLLLSSVFIYRPFCKSACPIGLALGFISRIPGAAVIAQKKENCIGCSNGSRTCSMDAINRINGHSELNSDECIMCGECIDSCKQKDLEFQRNKQFNNGLMKICRTASSDNDSKSSGHFITNIIKPISQQKN